MKLKITIMLSLISVVLATGQVKKWSLEECVAYAVENNLSIAQMELQLKNTKLGESDAFGAFLPNLNASARGSWNTGVATDPITNQRVAATFFSLNGGMSSNVTLFDGLRNVHRLNRAKMNTLASQYQVDDLKNDIMLNVANSYLRVLSSKEALKVVQLQAKITKEDYKRTKQLVAAEIVPKGDLLELEATIASFEQQTVNGENTVLLNRLFLAQLLQITDYENFDIADDSYEVPSSEIYNYTAKEIYAKAVTFRNEIKLAETNVGLAEKDLQISKGAVLPTLGASIGYNTTYSSRSLVSLGDQLSLNDGIGYGLNMSIPIFNGFRTKNNITRSRINIDRANVQLEQDKLTLEANINQAYLDVKSFAKSYEAVQKTLDARKQAYNFAKERFDVGLMNAFDFSQSQTRMDNAEVEVIRTKYDYIFRIKILEFYFGLPITLE